MSATAGGDEKPHGNLAGEGVLTSAPREDLEPLTGLAGAALETARHGAANTDGPGRQDVAELAESHSQAAGGHHSLDENGTILMMNDTELDWLGYSRDEVVGRLRFADLCTEKSRPLFEENFRKFKAQGRKQNVEYDLVRKDGSVLPILLCATPVSGPDGRYLRSRSTVFDLTQRRETEKRLSGALDEEKDLYENAPCGYHSIDRSGLFVRMNRTELGWLGYEREEVVGKLGALDVLTLESRFLFQGNLAVLKERGFVRDLEMEARRKDGTTFPILVHATAVYDDCGEFMMSRSTVIDLTARREIERSLKERDEFIRRIADVNPDFIYVLDLVRMKLVYGNRELAQIVGLPVEQIEAVGYLSLLHPEDFEPNLGRQELYENVSDAQVVEWENRIRLADGTWRCMHNRSVVFERGPDGRPTQILGIVQDVTRRKEAEDELERSEALYRTLVETVPVGIASTDVKGRISFASKAFCRLLGAETDVPLIGTRVAEWLAPESVAPAGERRRSPRPRGSPAEVKLRRLDGTTFWSEMVLEPMSSETCRFEGELVAFRDVTERHQRTERIRQDSGRMHVLSRRIVEVQEEERRHLARELHDEIGQTLTAILYRLEALQGLDRRDQTEILAETIRIADDGIKTIRSLSLSLRPAQLDEAGLAATLSSYVDRLALRRNLEVKLAVCPEAAEFPPELRTSCFRVVQEALTNVVRHANAHDLAITIWTDGDSAKLTVRDDGKGFDVEEARHRAAGGRSLGLFSMEERVELLGGRLVIQSEPGQGTEIAARFPLDWGKTGDSR